MSEAPIKVLLVEDNPHNRKIFLAMLHHAGFEVYDAEDGNRAIELAYEVRPDIILMDLSIPGVDGWEATRRLKSDPKMQDTPIVALTAHAMKGDEDRAREAGCDHYVSKPVSPKRVVEIVREYARPRTP